MYAQLLGVVCLLAAAFLVQHARHYARRGWVLGMISSGVLFCLGLALSLWGFLH